MTKSFKNISILAIGILVTQIGAIRGKWKEVTAPRMQTEDIATINATIDEQRQELIDYNYKVCQAFDLCASANLKMKNSEIVQACMRSAEQLTEIQISNIFPTSVKKNIEVFHQSMINGAVNIANAWGHVGKRGGAFWTHITNWEIDTCGQQSIPQKVYRLYGIQEVSHVKIVTCREIVRLHQNRVPASDKR